MGTNLVETLTFRVENASNICYFFWFKRVTYGSKKIKKVVFVVIKPSDRYSSPSKINSRSLWITCFQAWNGTCSRWRFSNPWNSDGDFLRIFGPYFPSINYKFHPVTIKIFSFCTKVSKKSLNFSLASLAHNLKNKIHVILTL